MFGSRRNFGSLGPGGTASPSKEFTLSKQYAGTGQLTFPPGWVARSFGIPALTQVGNAGDASATKSIFFWRGPDKVHASRVCVVDADGPNQWVFPLVWVCRDRSRDRRTGLGKKIRGRDPRELDFVVYLKGLLLCRKVSVAGFGYGRAWAVVELSEYMDWPIGGRSR